MKVIVTLPKAVVKGLVIGWMVGNQKESLEFNSMGVSVGSNDARFARYLGGLARDHNIVPLTFEHWPKISVSTKDLLWDTIHV